MRNFPPSTLAALPQSVHSLAELEAAFNSRRQSLANTVHVAVTMRRATIAERLKRIASGLFTTTTDPSSLSQLMQPTMSWVDGPRVQPRGPNGRFLSKAWLADAELFLPADRAWFRSPLSTEGK
jgi:hypothetical protein